ncbi:MAG TPA: hypothetical protein VGB14_04330 [Acidimicrobiales bacterium]|jgi:hypothetical protein
MAHPAGAPEDGSSTRLSIPDDWPAQAADTVVRVVGQVRDRTTGPAITVARGIVYGLLAAIAGIVAFVLLVAALVRLVDVLVPGEVWSAHLIVGAVLTLAGLLLWRKRRAPAAA